MGLADLTSLSGSAAAHAVLAGVAASPVRAGRLGVLSGATAAPCRNARWLLYAVLAALGIASGDGGFQPVREMLDARAFAIPGQLIDIVGHRLHLHCTGSGSPTVVLGHGATSSDLGWIAPAVAPDTKVCVYDRAGRGWSDAADGPQDAAQIAVDLVSGTSARASRVCSDSQFPRTGAQFGSFQLAGAGMGADRTDVDGGGAQLADVGQQLVLSLVGEDVGLGDCQLGVGHDVGFGPQAMADPAQTQLTDPLDAFGGVEGVGGTV